MRPLFFRCIFSELHFESFLFSIFGQTVTADSAHPTMVVLQIGLAGKMQNRSWGVACLRRLHLTSR
jgi:hypothetical protein